MTRGERAALKKIGDELSLDENGCLLVFCEKLLLFDVRHAIIVREEKQGEKLCKISKIPSILLNTRTPKAALSVIFSTTI